VIEAVHEEAQLDRLLEGIRGAYGYDFTRYARATVRRRLAFHLCRSRVSSLAQLHDRVLTDSAAFASLLDDLSIQVTAMFRDPEFYAALRRHAVPFLRTFVRLRLWVAGCASGEEALSVAILLHEEGLLSRSLIYATDVNPAALERARQGIYPADRIRLYADNYRRAGCAGSFLSYFTVAHGYGSIDPELTRHVHFAEHNLACDEAFGEMNLILCRNVLIYFQGDLQERVLSVLDCSLVRGGFLCLGRRESLRLWRRRHDYEELAQEGRIFRQRLDLGATKP
jgi:chemotaxis protein methyltransferase CheR